MKDSNPAELVLRVRSHVHTLSGLLTGVSASLYCSKIAAEKQSAESHISEAQQLTQEAEKELSDIREALRELDRLFEPQEGPANGSQ